MHKIALERNTPQGDIDRSLYFADESLLKVMKKWEEINGTKGLDKNNNPTKYIEFQPTPDDAPMTTYTHWNMYTLLLEE